MQTTLAFLFPRGLGIMDYVPLNLPKNNTHVHIFPPTIGAYDSWQECGFASDCIHGSMIFSWVLI